MALPDNGTASDRRPLAHACLLTVTPSVWCIRHQTWVPCVLREGIASLGAPQNRLSDSAGDRHLGGSQSLPLYSHLFLLVTQPGVKSVLPTHGGSCPSRSAHLRNPPPRHRLPHCEAGASTPQPEPCRERVSKTHPHGGVEPSAAHSPLSLCYLVFSPAVSSQSKPRFSGGRCSLWFSRALPLRPKASVLVVRFLWL